MIVSKLIYRFNIIPIKTQFVEIDKLILKVIWKLRGFRIARTYLEKNSVGRLLLPDFTAYYKDTF